EGEKNNQAYDNIFNYLNRIKYSVSANIYTSGEISTIVLGCLCGCVGLAAIVFFLIRTIR
ncbi:carbonic anhydrase 14-like isoform X1, partial [Clarias magur]